MADETKADGAAATPPDRGHRAETRLALAGFAALLVGLGIGRFAYTALVPALIREGWTDTTGAGFLAAANFAGYFCGALLSGAVARSAPLKLLVPLGFLACTLAYVASGIDLGFAWLAVWRFVPGFAGAVIMVLVPVAILAGLPPGRRPRAVGLIFTGIGVGIAGSGILVPWLAGLGVAVAWWILAAAALALTLATWPVWPGLALPAPAPPRAAVARPGWLARLPILLLFFAYACDAAGFVPHTVYWVDYVARGLDRGFGAAGTQWILFGLGAVAGPILVGRLAGRIGFGPALVSMLLVKAAAVLLPVLVSTLPALCLSSLVVGALTPGIATLTAGYVGEIAGVSGQRAAWGAMTTGFAATQALGASGFALLLGARGSYAELFVLGAALLLLAAVLAETGRRLPPVATPR